MTLVEKVAEYFKAHPGEWIDGKVIATVGGGYAWRTRLSESRIRYGLKIENRVRRIEGADGESYCVSEYRYTPAEAPKPAVEKHDANVWELQG